MSNNLLDFDHVNYEDFLKLLKLHLLQDIRLYLDTLSFICVYSVIKFCPNFYTLLVFEISS